MTAREGFIQYALERGLSLTCRRIDARPGGDDSDWARDARHFRCVLSRGVRVPLYRGGAVTGRRRMIVYFSQGSAHTMDPTIADILGCFQSDFQGADQTFAEWARDLGYDPDSRKAERIYRAVTRQRAAFMRLMIEPAHLSALFELEPL